MEKSKFEEGFEEVPVPLDEVTVFDYVDIVFTFRNSRFFSMSEFPNSMSRRQLKGSLTQRMLFVILKLLFPVLKQLLFQFSK